jgi:hypothetical protein
LIMSLCLPRSVDMKASLGPSVYRVDNGKEVLQ